MKKKSLPINLITEKGLLNIELGKSFKTGTKYEQNIVIKWGFIGEHYYSFTTQTKFPAGSMICNSHLKIANKEKLDNSEAVNDNVPDCKFDPQLSTY